MSSFAASESVWYRADNLNIETLYNVMRRNSVGSTIEQAQNNALSSCPRYFEEIRSKGYKVLFYKAKAKETASQYMFSGNCDVQVLAK